MGKSGVITTESKDNQVYHDVAILFKFIVLFPGVCKCRLDK